MEHLVPGVLLQDGHRFQRGERDLLGARVGEVDLIELDRGRTSWNVDRLGILGDHRHDVEDLEQALERDEAGHDVDVDVRELGYRAVEAGEVLGEGDDGADLDRTVRGRDPPEAVDEGRGDGRGQREPDEEEAGIGGLGDADVAHPTGLLLEGGGLRFRPPEQLDEHRPADVEALLHHDVHLGC